MKVTSTHMDHTLRVRFAETDAQGIVYYANYLVWFEIGRMEWMRARNATWKQLVEMDRQLVVAHAELDYRASARYDDEIVVRTFVGRVGNKSITFCYEIYRMQDMELLVTGNTVLVCVSSSGETVPVPPLLREPAAEELTAREVKAQSEEFARVTRDGR